MMLPAIRYYHYHHHHHHPLSCPAPPHVAARAARLPGKIANAHLPDGVVGEVQRLKADHVTGLPRKSKKGMVHRLGRVFHVDYLTCNINLKTSCLSWLIFVHATDSLKLT